MTKRVYIAGPVAGCDLDETIERFASLQTKLEKEGHTVINPVAIIQEVNFARFMAGKVELSDDNTKHRRVILSHCIFSLLRYADELHLLPGWQESAGSQAEKKVAEAIGLPVIEH